MLSQHVRMQALHRYGLPYCKTFSLYQPVVAISSRKGTLSKAHDMAEDQVVMPIFQGWCGKTPSLQSGLKMQEQTIFFSCVLRRRKSILILTHLLMNVAILFIMVLSTYWESTLSAETLQASTTNSVPAQEERL